jgi:hypothetical protein
MSARHQYPLTFDLLFAALVGGLVGTIMSVITGLHLRRFRRVWWAQTAGFGGAAVLGLPVAYLSHVLLAAPVAFVAYLSLLASIARRGQYETAAFPCPQCGYDLRGSFEAGRCPECGTAIDPTGLSG